MYQLVEYIQCISFIYLLQQLPGYTPIMAMNPMIVSHVLRYCGIQVLCQAIFAIFFFII